MPTAALLALNIALTVLAQTLLRNGMRRLTNEGVAIGKGAIAWAFRVGTEPSVLGGLGAFVGSLILWLVLLSRMKISALYPIQQSLVFVLIQGVAWRWLGEGMSYTKLAGVGVICVGVYLVARG